MANPNPEALKLPDSLLVRYFRDGEIEHVSQVTESDSGGPLQVRLILPNGTERLDRWRDLGGGLGYVPEPTPV